MTSPIKPGTCSNSDGNAASGSTRRGSRAGRGAMIADRSTPDRSTRSVGSLSARGVPFVRALCHLYHRATEIHGMQLDQFAMLHPYYCLSPLQNFISRLQSEIYTYSRSKIGRAHV